MSDTKIEPGWYWATYKLDKPEIVRVTPYAVLCTGTDREYPIEDFAIHSRIAMPDETPDETTEVGDK